MAGGTALNCVANARICAREGPFEDVWVQPAAGDAGHRAGRRPARRAPDGGDRSGADARPRPSAAAGPTTSWRRRCARAALPFTTPAGPRRRGRAGARRTTASSPGSRAQRVRPARARPPLAAGPPRPPAQPGADERRQGPRAVPPGRADGARWSGPRTSSTRPAPEPVHAVRARRRAGVAGPDPGGRARRRHRPGADRRPRHGAAGRRAARRVRAAHRPAGRGQHLAEHGRAADGGHPARGDGAVRLGAGRPARARPVRGPPRGGVRGRRPTRTSRRPRAGRSSSRRSAGPACASCSTRWPRRTPAAAPRSWSSTTGRRRARRRRGPLLAGAPPLPLRDPAQRRPRAGRGPQRRLAGAPATVGGVPRRRRGACPPAGRAALAARPAPRRRRRRPAASGRASACRCRPGAGRPTGSGSPRARRTARWITADMAYRRAALERVGGFDERFPRAFREDADLALRVLAAGWHAAPRRRATVIHPVRPEAPWVSLRAPARQRRRRPAAPAARPRLAAPRATCPRGRRRRHARRPPPRGGRGASLAAAPGGAGAAARRPGRLAGAAPPSSPRRRIAPGPADAARGRARCSRSVG